MDTRFLKLSRRSLPYGGGRMLVMGVLKPILPPITGSNPATA